MQALNDHQKEQLASLRDTPAFGLLLGLMEEFENGLLADLTAARSNESVVHAGRIYQYFRFVREFLKYRPEAIRDELESLKAQQREFDLDRSVWEQRFGPVQ